MDNDKPLVVTSFEQAVRDWPTVFKDLNNGGDTLNWTKLAFEAFGPALLENGAFHPLEEITWVLPVFMDDNPVLAAQADTKAKWNGKARQGLLVFTADSLTSVRENRAVRGLSAVAQRVELTDVTGFNPLTFGFSLISMTSAGPGYEVLLTPDCQPSRLLFRIALDPRDGESMFTVLFRQHLRPATA
ncbi:MAG: hypothetical protein LBI33_07365 [Propionibacteriaceae bacterium]|nr:hypothetical protein [Propionibacteriaceae bacterium]